MDLPEDGVLALFQGTVKDGATGADSKSMPPVASFEPGGYYYQNADNGNGLLISLGPGNQVMINGQPLNASPLGPNGRGVIRQVNPDYPDPDDPTVLSTEPRYDYTMDTNQATSWDDFLENLSGVVVKKRGSIVHMDNATLPLSLGETNPPLGILAWHRSWSSHYTPPVRDYGYDETLKKDPPPFQPVSATKILWQPR